MASRGRCARCNQSIDKGGALLAREKLYHANHFCCEVCGCAIAFNEPSYVLSDQKMACNRCFEKLAPKCRKCKQAIIFEYIVYAGNRYHQKCLQCSRCHMSLEEGVYEDTYGRPLDKDCMWGQILMEQIVNDVENTVPFDY